MSDENTAPASASSTSSSFAPVEPPFKKTKTEHSGPIDMTPSNVNSNGSNSNSIQDEEMKDGDGNSERKEDEQIRKFVESTDHTSRININFASSASSTSISAASSPLLPFAPTEWSYINKTILAPMVRIGTLPMRRLAVSYGCDIVYSEELVAKKLRTCHRVERMDVQGKKLIDFIPKHPHPQHTVPAAASSSSSTITSTPAKPAKQPKQPKSEYPVLTTYENEPLVVQVGASNADDALAAAQVVEKDARAIDLNCGCPKHFSLQGGMGAALLSKPETLADILTTLRRNINLPVTCKIRLLESDKDTVELVRRIEMCGVSAVAVHARRIEDRPRHRALRERIRILADSINIPLIYNGDCFYAHEIDEIKAATGAKSVMIARGAMWNPSIFRPDRVMYPLERVLTDYISFSQLYSNHAANSKYCIMEIAKGHISASASFKKITQCKDMNDLDAAVKYAIENEGAVLHKGGKDYTVPMVLEERPAYSECASTASGSVPVDVVLANGASTSAASSSSTSSSSSAQQPGVSRKEKKYLAKQYRKNREGRAKELEEAQAKGNVTESTATSATSSATASSSSAPMAAPPSTHKRKHEEESTTGE